MSKKNKFCLKRNIVIFYNSILGGKVNNDRHKKALHFFKQP